MLKRRDKLAAAGASGVVVVVTALGFILSGSPQSRRLLGADARRVDDLALIAVQLVRPGIPLPASLSELGFNSAYRTVDRLTGVPYEYRRAEGTRYSLCATFSLATPADQRQEPFWAHPAGHYCYSLDSSNAPPPHMPDYRYYR
jgi:hypothetical protein